MRSARRTLCIAALTLVLGGCVTGGADLLTADPAMAPGPICSASQRAMVDAARADARRHLAEAVRFVRTRPQDPHIRRWFGDAPTKIVLATLQETAARMGQPDSFTVNCNHPKSCALGQMAYTNPATQTIGVCPPFFLAANTGFDTRWGILIHEMSHLAARTSDHTYQPPGATQLAKQDPFRAARNADNYEYFVETLPR